MLSTAYHRMNLKKLVNIMRSKQGRGRHGPMLIYCQALNGEAPGRSLPICHFNTANIWIEVV